MGLITTEYDVSKCQCCGQDISQVQCVCSAYPEWFQNDNGDVACGYHKPALFQPERKTLVTAPETHDRFRNFR